MKKNKILTSGVAVALAGALLFGGTFAWQSISQTALNEVTASVNPGGRLHDDFNDITASTNAETMAFDKNVYVENFTELASNGVQVFARVRLDEYMELGAGAGTLNEDGTKPESNKAVSLVAGATLDDKSTWTTHVEGKTDDPFHVYWNWDMGGQTTYMPTFNKNKDSLEADINGSFANDFSDYEDYTQGSTKTANAIYDVDAAESGKEVDEIVQAKLTASQFIAAADNEALTALKNQIANVDTHIKVESEPHTAKQTLNAEVMTMERYMARLASTAEGNDNFDGTGDFWVYDTDGWAYWANPIDPATATGLLLNGISRADEIINQDWYYAINVVAQFVTGDDLGQDDQTGFYDLTEGKAPTAEALLLLNTIGVDVKFEVATADELAEALAHGGTVTLTSDISLSSSITVSSDAVLDLNGHDITVGTNIYDSANRIWSPISVQGSGTTLIIYADEGEDIGGITAKENDSYCIDVRDGAKVVIYGGKYKGNMTAVYVREGEAVIYGGEFSIEQTSGVSGKEYDYILNCYDECYQNGTAKITVCGGTFHKFDPSADGAGGDGRFVPNGYSVTSTGDNYYTVAKNAISTGE